MVDDISKVSGRLRVSLRVTTAPKSRETEAVRAKAMLRGDSPCEHCSLEGT